MMDTLASFSASFTKGDNIYDFLLAFSVHQAHTQKKRLAVKEINYFRSKFCQTRLVGLVQPMATVITYTKDMLLWGK